MLSAAIPVTIAGLDQKTAGQLIESAHAFWISAITRAVAMNSATTMRMGITVQATST